MWNIAHQRVERYVKDLGYTVVLAKRSEWNMVAIEAKYHAKCLVGLYNTYRAQPNPSSRAVHCEYDMSAWKSTGFFVTVQIII